MDTNQNESEHWGGDVPTEESSSGTSKGRLVFLFVVGFLLGVSIKAQAIKTVTMGYEDYKLKHLVSDFKPATEPAAAQPDPARQQQQDADTQDGSGAAQPDTEAPQAPGVTESAE